jgi:predicted dehydrogenase
MTVAVIGLGSIGLRHAFNAMEQGHEVIGYDPGEDRRALLLEKGGKIAASRDEALSKAKRTVICSPNASHLADLHAAIEHDCHALVEKPLSHTLYGLDEALKAADKKKLIIATAMNLRFHPVVKKSAEFLKGKKIVWARLICSSYLPNWRPQQDYRKGYTTTSDTGGVLFDLIHEIDLAHHLLGEATLESCVARKSGIIETKAEDCADLVLQHKNNVYSNVHLDYVSQNSHRFFEIQCEDGFLKGDLIKRRLSFINPIEEVLFEEQYEGSFAHDYKEEIKQFLLAADNKGGTYCSAAEALSVLKLTLEAKNS